MKLFVAIIICFVSMNVAAEKWSSVGILTTQIEGQDAVAKYVEIDDFGSEELCWRTVRRESKSDDYIGKGGTNNQLPVVQWNYDADCILKRND